MINFYRLFLLFFVINSTCYGVSFTQEKAVIDACLIQDHSLQIRHISDYVIEQLNNYTGDSYAQEISEALRKFDFEEYVDIADVHDAHRIVYAGLVLLKQLRDKENVSPIDVFEALDIASVVLSPALFNQDFVFPRQEVLLYEAVRQHKLRLKKVGEYLLDDKDEDYAKNYFWPDRAGKGYDFVSDHLTPCAMIGEYAIFSRRAYLYALMRGVALFGVTSTENDAHGGLYHLPAMLFPHDVAHVHELIFPHSDFAHKNGDHASMVKSLRKIAHSFYTLLYEKNVFAAYEIEKAEIAAFCLLHENRLYRNYEDFRKKWDHTYSLQDYVPILKKCFFNLVDGFLGKKTIEIWAQGHDKANNYCYEARTASDYARLVAQAFPDKEVEIYGACPGISRMCYYDKNVVQRLCKELVNWYCDRVQGM